MKRVISTKVDQATYAEFLEYCARVNKYPANAMRDALELLLRFDEMEGKYKHRIANLEEQLKKKPKTITQEVEMAVKCPKCHKEIGISNLKKFQCPHCCVELTQK